MNDESRKRLIIELQDKVKEQYESIDNLLEKISSKNKLITLLVALIFFLIVVLGLQHAKGQVKKFHVQRIEVDKKCKEVLGGIEIKDQIIYINVVGHQRWYGYRREFEHNGRTYYDVQSSMVKGFFILNSAGDGAVLSIYSKKTGYYFARYTFKKLKP